MMEYMESRMQDQIEGALHSQQEAMERVAKLESDLATAEQDSRQKQARIERLEAAVKELRGALAWMVDRLDEGEYAQGRCFETAREALKNTEDFA